MKKNLSMVLKNKCASNDKDVNFLRLEQEEFYEDHTLEYLQGAVGGYIECVNLSNELESRDIDMFINEEGKLIGLRPTMLVYHDDRLIDSIVGDCVFVKHRGDETVGLEDEDIEYVNQWVSSLDVHLIQLNNNEKQIVLIVQI